MLALCDDTEFLEFIIQHISFLLLPVLLVAHWNWRFAGSKNATKINQTLLKRIVAVASIAIACIKLFL